MRKGDLGSQLQLSTTEERRTRRFIIKDLSRLYVGIVAALVAVVMSPTGLLAGDCVRLGTVNPESEVVLLSAAVQVFDQQRKPIPGVTVAMTGGDLKVPARQTDSRGYVAFPEVLTGKYRVDIHLQGFDRLNEISGYREQRSGPGVSSP